MAFYVYIMTNKPYGVLYTGMTDDKSLKPYGGHMLRTRKYVGKAASQSAGEILIKEQLHAAGAPARRRSRSAAKARQARMSSRVSSGKSRSTSSSLMPPAR